MKFILRILIIALTILAISYFMPGIYVEDFWAAVIFAVLLGLANAFIRPLISLLTLPIKILTLGLFSFVINGLLFWLVAKFVSGVVVDSLLTAFIAALIVWAVSILANKFLKNKKGK
jgi:putative membrane protein